MLSQSFGTLHLKKSNGIAKCSEKKAFKLKIYVTSHNLLKKATKNEFLGLFCSPEVFLIEVNLEKSANWEEEQQLVGTRGSKRSSKVFTIPKYWNFMQKWTIAKCFREKNRHGQICFSKTIVQDLHQSLWITSLMFFLGSARQSFFSVIPEKCRFFGEKKTERKRRRRKT